MVVVEVVGGDFRLVAYDVTDLRAGIWFAAEVVDTDSGVGWVILVLTVRDFRGSPVPESFFAEVNPNVLSSISTDFSCTEFFLIGVPVVDDDEVCCSLE